MMKAITLHQYWASLMEKGLKTIETRGWATKHRGELAITAADRESEPFDYRLDEILGFAESLPRGAVLCVVNVENCIPVEKAIALAEANDELDYGDYSLNEGRYGWLTSTLRRLKTPVPCKGRQRIWTLPPDVEAKVRAQL